MKKIDFINIIENGSDIMLTVLGKNYTILTWTDDGIAIGEQYPNDGDLRYYATATELVNDFTVNGTPIGDLVDAVTITQYS